MLSTFSEKEWVEEIYLWFNTPVYDSWHVQRSNQLELLANMILVSHYMRQGFIIDVLDYEYPSDYELARKSVSRACVEANTFMGLVPRRLAMVDLKMGTYVCLKSRVSELSPTLDENDHETITKATSLYNIKNDGSFLFKIKTYEGGVVVENWCKDTDVEGFSEWAIYILQFVYKMSHGKINLKIERHVE